MDEQAQGSEGQVPVAEEQPKKKRRLFQKKEPPEPLLKELNYNNLSIRYDSALISKSEITRRNTFLYVGVFLATLLSIGIPMWVLTPLLERSGKSESYVTFCIIVWSIILAVVLLTLVYRLLMASMPRYFEFVEWILRYGKNDVMVGYHKGRLVILVRHNREWTRREFNWFPDMEIHDEDVDKNEEVYVTLDLTKATPVFNVINM